MIIWENETFKIDYGMFTVKVIQKERGRHQKEWKIKMKGIEKSWFIEFDMALDKYGVKPIHGLRNLTPHKSVQDFYNEICEAVCGSGGRWQAFFNSGWGPDEMAKECADEILAEGEVGKQWLK